MHGFSTAPARSWCGSPTGPASDCDSPNPTPRSTFEAKSESVATLKVIENAWRKEGFAVESVQAGKLRTVRATREVDYGPGMDDAADWAKRMVRVPDWLVSYMRDAISRSERRGEPLDLARLVRRTILPMNVLRAAKFLAEQVNDDASEAPRSD